MRILRILGIIVGVLVMLLVIAVIAVIFLSNSALNEEFDVTAENITIPDDAGTIARGDYLVHNVAACIECHGDNLEGDAAWIDDGVLGKIGTPNLTSGEGGVGAEYTDVDWVRSIRHGVNPDGQGLLIMPSIDYHKFTEADLASVIAYIKSLEPVNNDSHDISLTGGRLFLLLARDDFVTARKIDHSEAFAEPIERGATAEYGAYLASIACQGCHGEDYNGLSFPGGGTPAANLTPGGKLADYSEADFFEVLRTGVTPEDRTLDPDEMPWTVFAGMEEDDMRAIFLFLQSLPAMEDQS